MQKYSLNFFFLVCVAMPVLQAHDHYRSDASEVFATKALFKIPDRSVGAQVKEAKAFLSTLDEGLKKKAHYKLSSPERQRWTNLGTPKDAQGLRFSEMNTEQIEAALRMLATVMGAKGYADVVHIPLADDELLPEGRNQENKMGFGVANFTLLIFGDPSVDKPWGIQFDGHHLVYNLTIKGSEMSMSPSFIGTRPSTFDLGGKKISPLKASYADKAHEFIALLDNDQKRIAVKKEKLKMRSGAGKDGVIPKPVGVQVSTFNETQKKSLMKLISEYTASLPAHAAKVRDEELERELDQMYFAWGGPQKKGEPMSYMIQGPSLIIEYSCQGNGKKSLDHIHAIYRDPTNEYGAKLLK